MDGNTPNTLPKSERLHGKKCIERLLAEGKYGSMGPLRYRYLTGNGEDKCRILVSVPKKFFKRAVKRNLLKRRIRESWRHLKHQMPNDRGTDILFMYATKEILTYQEIYSHIERIISRLSDEK